MEIRKAGEADIAAVLAIMEEARAFQAASGNPQWHPGYPGEADITADIAAGRAYVYTSGGEVVGYVAIADGDDEYDRMPEVWRTPEPYGVMHRLALGAATQGKGAGREAFRLAEEVMHRSGARSVRIDTGLRNVPMQRLMDRLGYACRGSVTFSWGERLAYEKAL